MLSKILGISAIVVTSLTIQAGVVKMGSGSYSDAFPGTDAAGRNDYPTNPPQVSGKAAPKFGRALPLKNNAPKEDSKNTEEK